MPYLSLCINVNRVSMHKYGANVGMNIQAGYLAPTAPIPILTRTHTLTPSHTHPVQNQLGKYLKTLANYFEKYSVFRKFKIHNLFPLFYSFSRSTFFPLLLSPFLIP